MLLGFLTPEEQLTIDRMLINPHKNCTLDLMESLHLEKSQSYNLRAGALKTTGPFSLGMQEIRVNRLLRAERKAQRDRPGRQGDVAFVLPGQ